MRDIGTQTLRGKRLVLRRFKADDAEAMYAQWASDPRVTETVTWYPHKDVEETKALLKTWVKAYENPWTYRWAIETKDGTLIGSIDFVSFSDTHQSGEVGYCLAYDYWNQGLATEALEQLIAFMFDQVGLNRIEAKYLVGNPASKRVMEKVGMQFEGVHRQMYRIKGRTHDLGRCAIVKDDYEKDRR